MPVSLVFGEAADALGVFVRPAEIGDAEQLIQMNKNFRLEMAQWETEAGGEDSGYPVLDYEDVTFILEEEEEGNLMVMGRRLDSEESLIGYSYSYTEPWESAVSPQAKRTKTATPRKNARGGKAAPLLNGSQTESTYIAELFIAESDRGLGLGELLLSLTLNQHARSRLGSHLFVSSKNTGAVRCYQKFGYSKCSRPSGDAAHDLIMELRDCRLGSEAAASRFAVQLEEGTIGARRRRRPTAPYHPSRDEKKASPVQDVSRSESRESAAPTALASRSSSRNSFRNSPPPCELRPRAVHGVLVDDNTPLRRVTRSCDSSLNDSRSSHGGSPFLASEDDLTAAGAIQGRQRKERRLPPPAEGRELRARGAGKRERNSIEDEAQGEERRELRSAKRSRFMMTGMTDRKKQQAEKTLKALGGDVIPAEIVYDPSCTHLIAADEGLRTEKYLCALAANKPILRAEYISDSLEAGALLPEAGYEYPAAACLGARAQTADIVGRRATRSGGSGSPKGARSFALTGNPAACTSGCFAGMSVVLIVADKNMAAGLRRCLQAGGASLRGEVSNVSPKALALNGATHAFVSRDLLSPEHKRECEEGWTEQGRKAALRVLAELQSRGVECMYRDYPVEMLTSKDVSPDQFRIAEQAASARKSGPLSRVFNAGIAAIQLLSPKRLRQRPTAA